MGVNIGSKVNWIMYEVYLKSQDAEIEKAIANYKKLIDTVGREMGGKYTDDSSVAFIKWFATNMEGIKAPYQQIVNSFFVENWYICRQLKSTQPTTYSQYSKIKTYGNRPVPAVLLEYNAGFAIPKGMVKVDKNVVNELTERLQKIIKNFNKNINNINSIRNRFLRGEFGIEVKGGFSKLDTYTNRLNDFLRLVESRLNTAIIKSNTSVNLSILK